MKNQIVYDEDGNPVGVLDIKKGEYLPLLTNKVVNGITEIVNSTAENGIRELSKNIVEMIFGGVTTIVVTRHSSWVAGFQYDSLNEALIVYTKREGYNDEHMINLDKYYTIENVTWSEVSYLIETAKVGNSIGRVIHRMQNARK